jgi:ATP-dependent Zn protease
MDQLGPYPADLDWEGERAFLIIARMRRGLLALSEDEGPHIMAAFTRLSEEIGDSLERTVIHEAGHAVVAHRFGWLVEYMELMPNGAGAAMTHQPRHGSLSRNANDLDRFQEQVAVGIAGYIAEEIKFGLSNPFEVIDLRTRAYEEHGLGDLEFGELIAVTEPQVQDLLKDQWATVERLSQALLTNRRLESEALAACFK